eukprot:Gregarina_sp_Poly_1__5701@NODE_2_length_28028_cov_167_134223_g1_i0_p10_GENE_NODE_2_length_28028_cov_167_134223_g1_i0NODE_2_length_28028_cov_167_134223_g1_i0_p10_ORF_typecomplete_len279_score23_80RNase_P_p30/PF01876_16/5_3e37_NODE_2_length_28028_cov_167_134223_g1_i02117222008
MILDLNVAWNQKTAKTLLSEAGVLGYDGIAFTTCVDSSERLKSNFYDQTRIEQDSSLLRLHHSQGFSVRNSHAALCFNFPPRPGQTIQLKRLHVTLTSSGDFANFAAYMRNAHQGGPTGPNLFDLVSVEIRDEKVWQLALQQPFADIIVLDFYASRLPFTLKRSQILLAARQHVYFEICLGKAMIDPSCCKQLFRNLPYLLRFLPTSRLLVTSGASTPLQMRAPQDLIPLIQMLGLESASAALAVLSENATNVLSRSSGRRSAGPGYPLPVPEQGMGE